MTSPGGAASGDPAPPGSESRTAASGAPRSGEAAPGRSGVGPGALVTDTPLSFWGGVDPATGRIVDRHHPLHGQSLAGRVLAMPTSRGSCSGSGVVLELLTNGCAPAAVLHSEPEDVVTLGAVVADELFGFSLPVRRVGRDVLDALRCGRDARFDGGYVDAGRVHLDEDADDASPGRPPDDASGASGAGGASAIGWPLRVGPSPDERAMLEGARGEAARLAMRVVLRMAALQGASGTIVVTRVHVDGCLYSGPSSLRFAERLVALGARVRVPTTLNALSVDRRRWRAQGVDPAFGEPAAAVGDAYVAMGAAPGHTCAPYLLDDPPRFGEQIAWAESNAVVYANSVLGARTQKYPDFLDICIALTGRAPRAGCHLDAHRRASVRVHVDEDAARGADDAFWPLLGHHVGRRVGDGVPQVTGLERGEPSADDLKAFCAAFATTAPGALCHVAGVTPEAPADASADATLPTLRVTAGDLRAERAMLNTATDPRVDLVCLGNPHFSVEECAALAALCAGRTRHPDTGVVVTTARVLHERARTAGHVAALERFGVAFVTDTCWCMLQEPLIPPHARTLMTNSAKYAHYAPGLVGREVHFGSLAECVEAACTGRVDAL